MSRLIRIAAFGTILGVIAGPATAQQPYGYSAPGTYGPPPPPAYGPPAPAYGPPASAYGPPPPGSRCEASFGPYRRRFICPMRRAKPVGAPCHCVPPPPAPGYPPAPAARGRVIP